MPLIMLERWLSMRRAAAVAEVSCVSFLDASDELGMEVVPLLREQKTLQTLIKSMELQFLNQLVEMEDLQQATTLIFEIIDKDSSGELDVLELGQALQKVTANRLPSRAVTDLFVAFDTSHDGKLDAEEFHRLIGVLSQQLKCEVTELCALFVIKTTFASYNGTEMLQSQVDTISAITSKQRGPPLSFQQLIERARIQMLFEMMSGYSAAEGVNKPSEQTVSFQEVLEHVFYDVDARSADPSQRKQYQLKMQIEGMLTSKAATLNAEQFTAFFLEIIIPALVPIKRDFNVVANNMTSSFCRHVERSSTSSAATWLPSLVSPTSPDSRNHEYGIGGASSPRSVTRNSSAASQISPDGPKRLHLFDMSKLAPALPSTETANA